jgi:hypothetical protein
LLADPFQGYSLDQILGLTTEAGGAGNYTMSLSSFGDYGDRYLCEEWVALCLEAGYF